MFASANAPGAVSTPIPAPATAVATAIATATATATATTVHATGSMPLVGPVAILNRQTQLADFHVQLRVCVCV